MMRGPWIILVLVLVLAGAYIAGERRGAAREADRALAAQAKADRAALVRIQEAEDRADRIDRMAAQRVADLSNQLMEARHAVKAATTGRPCLGGPALRVLEQSPGLRLGVPASAVPLHGGPATAAAHPQDEGSYASDTDIADWIAQAGALYEGCRGRIRDIRQWSEGGQ